MKPSLLPFASLFLLDHRTGAPTTEVPILSQTTIGCFAAHPDAPSEFMPGYLTMNYYLRTATFGDFEATARAKRLGGLLKLPLLAGALGVLAMVVAFIVEMDAPVWSEGLWASGLFRSGLAVLALAIAFTALILTVSGRSSAAGWRSMIEIPEPIFSELCGKYQSLQLEIKEVTVNSAKTPSLGGEIKISVTNSTLESVAESILPAGLAKIAVHIATESKDSGDQVKLNDRLKFSGIDAMREQIQYHHQLLTGRNALSIPQPDFLNFSRATESQLLTLSGLPA